MNTKSFKGIFHDHITAKGMAHREPTNNCIVLPLDDCQMAFFFNNDGELLKVNEKMTDQKESTNNDVNNVNVI